MRLLGIKGATPVLLRNRVLISLRGVFLTVVLLAGCGHPSEGNCTMQVLTAQSCTSGYYFIINGREPARK